MILKCRWTYCKLKIWFITRQKAGEFTQPDTLTNISCCITPDIAFAVNKLAEYSNNPGLVHYRAILYLISYIKGTSHKFLMFYSNMKESPIFKILKENNIIPNDDTIITFSDSSLNNCVDTGRSTGGNILIM